MSRTEHLIAVIVAALVSAWVALTILLSSMPAWGLVEPTNMWERSGWDGWRAHVMIFWPVFLLLAVVGVISLSLKIYHDVWPGTLQVSARSPVASGHRILAERFARGEIDETEYRAKRKALGKR